MCKKCKSLVPSLISQANRRKGCKTICLNCNSESKGWKNYQNLQLWDVEAELNTAQVEIDKETALRNPTSVLTEGIKNKKEVIK